jgi:hypothetical protein
MSHLTKEAPHQYFTKVKQKMYDWFDLVWEEKKQIEIKMYYGNREHLWVGYDTFRSSVYAPPEVNITETLCLRVAQDLQTYILSQGLNATISLKTEHVAAYRCFDKMMTAHDTTYVSVVITP